MSDRIAVMGAGAVGCYYGAKLVQGGADVTLIGRAALADAVAARGLLLEEGGQTVALPVRVAVDAAGVAGADLVLVCVKSGDSAEAARQIAPHLGAGTVVLSLQNGVGNADTLAAALGRPVIPVVVYVATEMAGAGHVRHHGRGELVLGPGPGAEAAAATLRAHGIRAEVSPDALAALWTKFVINCTFNAVSALSRAPYGRIWAEAGAQDTLRALMEEVLAVARAEGIALPETLWPQITAIADGMPGQYSSTAQDLMRGKPTEIAHLNGAVLRLAERHGIAVPLNRAMTVLVRLAEGAPPPSAG